MPSTPTSPQPAIAAEQLSNSPGSSPGTTTPSISLINAVAFVRACKLEGSAQFSIHLCPPGANLRSSSISGTPSGLRHVPHQYHDFADVFNKVKADSLP